VVFRLSFLLIGKDNKIYVGGQDDFDWFSTDKNASLNLHR